MAFNDFVTHLDLQEEKIQEYDNIFMIGGIGALSIIKMRLIQEMIQIERPVNWTMEKIVTVVNEIRYIEMYNATLSNKLEKTKRKWDKISNICIQLSS
jgi:hypothetical protein